MGRNHTRQKIMCCEEGGEEFKCEVADARDGAWLLTGSRRKRLEEGSEKLDKRKEARKKQGKGEI
jgi:hypothetical protein